MYAWMALAMAMTDHGLCAAPELGPEARANLASRRGHGGGLRTVVSERFVAREEFVGSVERERVRALVVYVYSREREERRGEGSACLGQHSSFLALFSRSFAFFSFSGTSLPRRAAPNASIPPHLRFLWEKLRMSAAGKGTGAAPKGGNDKGKDDTIAKVTGVVIASGIAWSLYKSFRTRSSAEKPVEIEQIDKSEDVTEVIEEVLDEMKDRNQSFFEKVSKSKKSKSRLDKEYAICKGDTLWGISRRYGVPIDDLKALNGIGDADYIIAGDTLVISK